MYHLSIHTCEKHKAAVSCSSEVGKRSGIIMGAVSVAIYSVCRMEMFRRQARGLGNCSVTKSLWLRWEANEGVRRQGKMSLIESALIFLFLERLVCHLAFSWNNFSGVAISWVFSFSSTLLPNLPTCSIANCSVVTVRTERRLLPMDSTSEVRSASETVPTGTLRGREPELCSQVLGCNGITIAFWIVSLRRSSAWWVLVTQHPYGDKWRIESKNT